MNRLLQNLPLFAQLGDALHPPTLRRAAFAALVLAAGLVGVRATSAQEVTINFNNKSGEEVHVFWQDPEGKENRYHILKPNDAQLQQTFAGHRWVFRRANGALLGVLIATRSTEQRFDPPAKPEGQEGAPFPGRAPVAEVPVDDTPRPAPAEPVAPEAPAAGTRTKITWKNASQNDVEVLWVGDDGAETAYGVIKPGTEFSLATVIGHRFVLRETATRSEIGRTTISRLDQKILFGFNRREVTPTADPAAPRPLPEPQPRLQPRVQGEGGMDVRAEAAKAIERINEVRANPAQFANLHRSLADADVQARPPLVVSKALTAAAERKAQWMAQNERDDSSQFAHVITIKGEITGMNKWMREAGYPLVEFLKDTDTNFECLAMEGGRGSGDFGKRMIDNFMAEGKDGGHVLPTLGRGWWAPCKDVGVGIAVSPKGNVYMSLLVGVYDPFNPEAKAP